MLMLSSDLGNGLFDASCAVKKSCVGSNHNPNHMSDKFYHLDQKGVGFLVLVMFVLHSIGLL